MNYSLLRGALIRFRSFVERFHVSGTAGLTRIETDWIAARLRFSVAASGIDYFL